MAKTKAYRWRGWRTSLGEGNITRMDEPPAPKTTKPKKRKTSKPKASRYGPSSPKQLDYIAVLCDQVGGSVPTGKLTAYQAHEVIQGLLSRKALGLVGTAATMRTVQSRLPI